MLSQSPSASGSARPVRVPSDRFSPGGAALRRLPLLAALALSLGACAPALSDATLSLSPTDLRLRRGQTASVTVWFKRYVFGEEQSEGYRLNVLGLGARGLRVTTFGNNRLRATDTATFQVTAARNADLGRQTIPVLVSDDRGHHVQQTLTVQVVE